MQTVRSYDEKKYPECPPFYGKRGQSWDTFCRDFAAAMSKRDIADDSLEETLYGTDIGGDRWIEERYPDFVDASGTYNQGNLIRIYGASPAQARGHTRRD